MVDTREGGDRLSEAGFCRKPEPFCMTTGKFPVKEQNVNVDFVHETEAIFK